MRDHSAVVRAVSIPQRVRIRELNNNGTTVLLDRRYVWDGPDIVEEREGTSNQVLKQYFPQGVRENGTTNFYYTRDHLGSVREVTDASRNLVARYDYDPWGRQTTTFGTKQVDFTYAGYFTYRTLYGTPLYLTWFRAYDPFIGRWLSRDPTGEDDGPNLYTYVADSPTNFADPLGLCSTRCCIDQPLKINVLSNRNDANYLGIGIEVTASFKAGGPCNPTCCEVRQDVIGNHVFNGVPFPTTTPAGNNLSPNGYVYDWFGYGLQGPRNGNTNSYYTPGPSGGISFRGEDYPGLRGNSPYGQIGLGSGVWMGFKLYVWDRCNNQRVGNRLRYGFSGSFGGRLNSWGY